MIRSFKDKGLKAFWETGSIKGLCLQAFANRIRRILALLDNATRPEDCNAPGYDWHKWRGDPPTWSMKINGNWRVLFGWDQEPIDVRQEDPHS
jgi:toxin HigB-1